MNACVSKCVLGLCLSGFSSIKGLQRIKKNNTTRVKEVQHKVPQKKRKKKKEERRYRSSSRLFSASKKPQVSHPALPARPNKGYRELKGHKVKNSLSQGVLRLSELPDVACKYLQRSFFSKKPLRECSQKERG